MIFRGLRQGTIQYASDLHLNHKSSLSHHRLIKPAAPYLILAGDLNDGVTLESKTYLRQLSKHFDEVIMIPGNHDYYHKTSFQQAQEDLNDLEHHINNLKILSNQEYFIADINVRILGTTLWSYIPINYHLYYHMKQLDYKRIKHLTPEITNRWHQQSVDWLTTKLNSYHNDQVQTIVVTHHAPLIEGSCKPVYSNNRLKYGNHSYCTDLSSIINKLPPTTVAWIFGHTHHRCEFQTKNGLWLLNHHIK